MIVRLQDFPCFRGHGVESLDMSIDWAPVDQTREVLSKSVYLAGEMLEFEKGAESILGVDST